MRSDSYSNQSHDVLPVGTRASVIMSGPYDNDGQNMELCHKIVNKPKLEINWIVHSFESSLQINVLNMWKVHTQKESPNGPYCIEM